MRHFPVKTTHREVCSSTCVFSSTPFLYLNFRERICVPGSFQKRCYMNMNDGVVDNNFIVIRAVLGYRTLSFIQFSQRGHSISASCMFMFYMANIQYTVASAPWGIESNMRMSYAANRSNRHSNSGSGSGAGFDFPSPHSIGKYKYHSSARSKILPSSIY